MLCHFCTTPKCNVLYFTPVWKIRLIWYGRDWDVYNKCTEMITGQTVFLGELKWDTEWLVPCKHEPDLMLDQRRRLSSGINSVWSNVLFFMDAFPRCTSIIARYYRGSINRCAACATKTRHCKHLVRPALLVEHWKSVVVLMPKRYWFKVEYFFVGTTLVTCIVFAGYVMRCSDIKYRVDYTSKDVEIAGWMYSPSRTSRNLKFTVAVLAILD